ncbi:MAG: hypothetical protein KF789_14605, partial [Bdellovibrionaceae bacterium]|nr:hypothetical protein [Pseudobdellovibrionaceae bacterium]
PLNKTDLMDAQLKTKVTVVVNSRRFNRIDIQDLQRAGVAVSVQTFGLSLTAADYQEIARTGPLSLEINSKTLTKQEILSLASMDGVRVSVDPLTSGLSGSEIQEISAVATK